MSDSLSSIFNIEPSSSPVNVITTDNKEITIAPDGAEDEDYNYARARSYELAEKGHEALDVAMRVVREAESPAAITALSTLIKTLSDVNKNLLSLNKDKADAKAAKVGQKNSIGQAVQTQNNIIFTGDSKSLNKLIQEQLGKQI